MPYCPKCGYEYLPTVQQCPDCGAALTPEPPAEPQPIEEPLVAVYEAPDEVREIMVRTVLQEAGIAATVQSGFDLAFDGLLGVPSGHHSRLLVFESRAQEARRIIAEYLAEVETGEAEREAVEEEATNDNEQV